MQPDASVAEDFLVRLHGRATAGLTEIVRLGPVKAELFLTENVELAAARAAEWNAVEGANIYFGASIKKPGTWPHARTTDADFLEAWALHADFDAPGAVEAAFALADKLGIPPTLIVTTGTHPYPRAHFWWLLEEPIRDAAEYRALLKLLATVFGGDPTVVNPGRIMRLPGMIAWPVKYGRKVELVTWAEASGRVYLPGEIPKVCGAQGTLYSDPNKPRAENPAPNNADRPRGPEQHENGLTYATTGLGLPGKIIDGRELYMRDTLYAVAIELMGALGRRPTGEEIDEAAWPQYEAHVDLSRPGRGREEFKAKAHYTAHRLATGAIEGEPSVEEAARQFQAQQQERARQEAPRAPPNGPPPPPGANGEWQWEDDEPPKGEQPKAGPHPGPRLIRATPVGLDWDKITKPRRWIYGRHLIGGFVSLTVAPGGVGKTALLMVEAVAIATGKPLLGEQVHHSGPTWHFNLEDPLDELQRRLGAIVRHYKVDMRDIAGRMHVDSGGLIVAKRLPGLSGGMVAMPDADALIDEIKRLGIMVLSVDPFVLSHGANENDNGEIAFVGGVFNRIAKATGAAIALAHHTRKPPAGSGHADGDINQSRGASALAGVVRAARTLSPMSSDDAAKLGVTDEARRSLIRLDDAKANMAPPRERAVWLQLHSIDIENADGLDPSDWVAALVPWHPTAADSLISPTDQDAVLKEIDRAFAAGNGYSPRNQEGEPRRYSLAFERALSSRSPDGKIQARVVRHWLDSKVQILSAVKAQIEGSSQRGTRMVLRVHWENVTGDADEAL